MIEQSTGFTLIRSGTSLVGESLGAGPDVLLLHAGGEDRTVWRPIMQALANRGFRSVAFDQRGHGESQGSMGDGIHAYGLDAVEFIGKLTNPIVVGGSLGGFALMLALERCEPLVSGLVLVDVTPCPDPQKTRSYLSPRKSLGASPLVEEILSQSERLSHIVSKLQLPMLFVGGGCRSPIDQAARARLTALTPQTKVKLIEQASHLVARDAPLELSGLIAEFAGQVVGSH